MKCKKCKDTGIVWKRKKAKFVDCKACNAKLKLDPTSIGHMQGLQIIMQTTTLMRE